MEATPTKLLCPWGFPGNSTGVDCHFLLQGIFPTQGSNPGLPHWQEDSLPVSHKESTLYIYPFWIFFPFKSPQSTE